MKIKSQLCRFGLAFFFLFSARVNAGTFSCDFNSDLPANTKIHGDTKVANAGGVSGSGVLKLTSAQSNQQGTFIIDSLDDAGVISGFTAGFKVLMGGGRGGDGFSFCFAPDLPDGVITEMGAGSGLVVTFDSYKNSIDKIAPAIRVYWQNKLIGETGVALRLQRFVEVFVQVSSDGTFNLAYDGAAIFTNLSIGSMNMSGRFAFGSRTGGWFDNHWIDDLNITTDVSMPSFIKSFSPVDDNAAPDTAVQIALADWDKVNLLSVKMKIDGIEVTALTVTNGANVRVIQHQPADLLEPGSNHAVQLTFINQGVPPKTNSFSYRFSVNPNILLSK